MNNTILVVDDLRMNIDAMATILKDDYKVMAAISGESAIKLLEHRQPDLVLLDVSMPGLDGFDVLRYIKQHKELASIPVIFITGEHDVNAEEKGLAMGAVDYIKKPFNGNIVRVKVRNHLELKAYKDNLEALVYERTRQLEERSRQLEVLTAQLRASRDAVIMGMSLMSETHDSITGRHIERIKLFAQILTQSLLCAHPHMLSPDLAHAIVLYSPLHDVGKVGISDIILKKTGVLTPDEYHTMKRHTLEGATLLRKTEGFLSGDQDGINLDVAIEIAECHHERFDGSGYPHGFSGEDIPLSARIVALADVYDALRSPRQYKSAFSHEEALKIIVRGDTRTEPTHFDPRVLETFCAVHQSFRRTYDENA